MGLANVYLSTKDYDQAIEVYQEALEADKTAYEVSFALYSVYEEKWSDRCSERSAGWSDWHFI